MSEATSSGVVLLVGSDLNAVARVESAARAVGVEFAAVPPSAMEEALMRRRALLVLLDLDEGGAALLDDVERARADGSLQARAIAFFSHVDEAAGRRAEEAGVRALPRGRFWRELPDLVAAAVAR